MQRISGLRNLTKISMDLNDTLKAVKDASYRLAVMDDSDVRGVLGRLADALEADVEKILEANSRDLEKISEDDPIYDRVLLDEGRVRAIAGSVREIAGYDSPIGEVIEAKVLENGLDLKKVRVPFGVIGVIFEARPNVVIDIFTLCFKSKNACVLKGGSQSEHSNEVLVEIIKGVLEDKDVVALLPNDRALVAEFLKADDYVNMIVPRGGAGLIKFVRENSLIPVIETGAGVVHTYFDEFGDLEKGKKIVFNAKTSRPSVCNALDTLIVHASRLDDLAELCAGLTDVEIRADERALSVLEGAVEAREEDFGMEYLSLKMSVKVVESLDEAIGHVNFYGSSHSEAIVTENEDNAARFLERVDAAAVYVNASTRFTDGGVFGLGAEVGISTQKLHARGPMGIRELTSYKWQIVGDGQVR